jgi:hypothetical protein
MGNDPQGNLKIIRCKRRLNMSDQHREHTPLFNESETRIKISDEDLIHQQEDHTTLMSKIIYGEKLYNNERRDSDEENGK